MNKKTIKKHLDSFRKSLKGHNFDGSIMDDVWSDQLIQAAMNFIPQDLMEVEDDDDETMVEATNIVMVAFLKDQGFVRKGKKQ